MLVLLLIDSSFTGLVIHLLLCFIFEHRHDKRSLWSDSSRLLLPRIVQAPFFASPLLQQLLERAEDVCTVHLYDNNRAAAMQQLQVQPQVLQPWVLFSLGSAFGISIILFVIFILIIAIREDAPQHWCVPLGFLQFSLDSVFSM
jgi:hypothetical protein